MTTSRRTTSPRPTRWATSGGSFRLALRSPSSPSASHSSSDMSPGSPSAHDDGRPVSLGRAAIVVKGVSKTFRLPHERRTTLKEYVQHPLRRTGYEEQRALDGISFTVEPGEFFGII